MNRREFIYRGGLLTATFLATPKYLLWAEDSPLPAVRIAEDRRKFRSAAIEKVIEKVKGSVGNRELAVLFENCFPNTLDTTVQFAMLNGKPDTYVITGDIDAMWLRDSTAQVYPYLPFTAEDSDLKNLIAGVINRQVRFIRLDPYANAFYKNPLKQTMWKNDITEMRPGVHERKWEIDSLCYPIRLAYGYWKTTGDTTPFDEDWKEAIALTVKTFKEQQRKENRGTYRFFRGTVKDGQNTDELGYGPDFTPNGLIFSMFRPSDDATQFPLLIPSNFFAVVSLRQAAEMLETFDASKNAALVSECRALADEVALALETHAVIDFKTIRIFAYEIDGTGRFNTMDDANVPSLLSLPYLGAVKRDNETYTLTRSFILSKSNRFFFTGTAAEGVGSQHTPRDHIWPIGLIMQAMTSVDDEEITRCLRALQTTHAGTGFMHESFHKNDPNKFSRKWFAWANTLFGEMILKVLAERPHLLK